MSPQRFIVATDLSLGDFDDVARGRALVRLVMVEIRELRRVDPRVSRARMRVHRGRHEHVEVVLTIEAPTPWDAYEIGTAVMRAAIHAAGGSTVGWERSCPKVLQISTPEQGRRGRRAPSATSAFPARERLAPSWSEAAAIAARRAASAGPLPSFAGPSFEPQLIDLR